MTFTQNIQRHVKCPTTLASGETVREVLDEVFEKIPEARGYVLDEHGELRKHMSIFIDGGPLVDRALLSAAVRA